MTQLDTNGDTYAEQTIVNDRHKEHVKDLIFYLTLTIIVVAVLLTRIFVFESYRVIGDSMFPTVQADDVVWINKIASPKRGDIVVVYDPQLNKPLIKRVIALDGDKIYAEKTDSGYTIKVVDAKGNVYLEQNAYNNVNIPPINASRLGNLALSPVTVSGIYLLGDNRNVSEDSRFLGTFDYKQLRGVVIDIFGKYK